MIKLISIIIAIVSGFIIFAIIAGVIAALFSYLVQIDWNPSSGITMIIGIVSEFAKYGLSIYGGYKIYRSLIQRISFDNPRKL